VQDSSVRNDFNEYREILKSHNENYSEGNYSNDDFTSSASAMESLNVSNTILE